MLDESDIEESSINIIPYISVYLFTDAISY